MKVTVIQSDQKNLYDVNNPGIFNLHTCEKSSKQVIEQNFKLMGLAAKEGTNLIVTTEAINVSIFPNDARYNFADSVDNIEGELFKRFCRFSMENNIYIVAGLYNRRNGNAKYQIKVNSFKDLRPTDYWFEVKYSKNEMFTQQDVAFLTPKAIM